MGPLRFICGLNILFIVAVSESEAVHEGLSILVDYSIDCMDAENATTDDSKAIGSWTMPTTREGQCMAACIAEKIGMIVGGKFEPEGAVKGTSMLLPPDDVDRDETIEQMSFTAEECRGIENEDRCQLIVDIINCLHN